MEGLTVKPGFDLRKNITESRKMLYFSALKLFGRETLILVLIFFSSQFVHSQVLGNEVEQEEETPLTTPRFFEPSANISLFGYYNTDDVLPFWMHQNTRGRITKTTNFGGLLSGKGTFNWAGASVDVGAGVLYQDGNGENVFVDELFIHLRTLKFYATVGRMQQEMLYDGLSPGNQNILWSLNARPMPGLQIGTRGPLYLKDERGFGVEGSWNEYIMEGDRHVRRAWVHNKNLRLVYKTQNNFQVKAGIRHYAQWGGTSKTRGLLPGGSTNYLKTVMAIEEEGDANHLGSYEIMLQKELPNLNVEFFYNYLYEDDNRMNLSNFPDGRYGLYLNFTDRDRVIDKVLYELTYTKNQSSKGWHKSNQNYFNHWTFRSGWTYRDRVIGSPFFTYDTEREQIVNNKFIMHHLGISGSFSDYFKSFPYKLMLSGGRNDGTYPNRYYPNEDVFYWSYEMRLLESFMDLSVQVAGAHNSTAAPVFGIGISLHKSF